MTKNMHEPALDFTGVTVSLQKETVRVFYEKLWDRYHRKELFGVPRTGGHGIVSR